MLRRLQVTSNKQADATFKASEDTVRGRIVQKDYANGVVVYSATPSAGGLYFVDKGNFPTGLATLEGDLSDYDTRFENISEGEYVILEKPLSGEVYGTTEYVSTGLSKGNYLTIETVNGADQGKFKKSVSPTAFVYGGTLSDNGHTLAIVEIQ